jgi:hypothetical protein
MLSRHVNGLPAFISRPNFLLETKRISVFFYVVQLYNSHVETVKYLANKNYSSLILINIKNRIY